MRGNRPIVKMAGRVANRFERTLGAASLRALSKGAVFEFSFHAIHTIELKFTIDKHTASMVALRVLSRTNLAEFSLSTSFTSSISFTSFRLRTLELSLRSFSHSRPLFSTTSTLPAVAGLFLQNTRGGIPPFILSLCVNSERSASRRYPYPSPISAALVSTFRINTYRSVSKQITLTSFRINTGEKHREGRGIVNQTNWRPKQAVAWWEE